MLPAAAWSRLFAVVALVLPLAPATALPAGDATALRAEGRVFARDAALEVRGIARDRAHDALTAAWAALQSAERELAVWTRPAAGVTRSVPAELLPLVQKADAFCRWSDGSVSPLAGQVYALWGLRQPARGLPPPDRLEEAAASARCEHWRFDAKAGTLSLDPGTALDFWSFERGWAVDRAVEALVAAGARNAEVRVGEVVRGLGEGPDGHGWRQEILLSSDPGENPERISLRDQSLAVASASEPALQIAGERITPYLDLRSGRPVQGVARVAAVTDLALDAQALSAAMFVFGPSGGALRLGVLRPKPSVLWVLGDGRGVPVFSTSNWAAVKRP